MRYLAALDPAKFAVAPFHNPHSDKCEVIEVSSEATLKCLGLSGASVRERTKKEHSQAQSARHHVVASMMELSALRFGKMFPKLALDKKVFHFPVDASGALEALIACYTVAIRAAMPTAFPDPFDVGDENVLLEGWIYAPSKLGATAAAKGG